MNGVIVRDAHARAWRGAAEELATRYARKERVPLWYRDEELQFEIVVIKRRPHGDYIRLQHEGVTAVIQTEDGSDAVDLRFYSKG